MLHGCYMQFTLRRHFFLCQNTFNIGWKSIFSCFFQCWAKHIKANQVCQGLLKCQMFLSKLPGLYALCIHHRDIIMTCLRISCRIFISYRFWKYFTKHYSSLQYCPKWSSLKHLSECSMHSYMHHAVGIGGFMDYCWEFFSSCWCYITLNFWTVLRVLISFHWIQRVWKLNLIPYRLWKKTPLPHSLKISIS